MVFSILFYFSFLQYSVFLFTFLFCGLYYFVLYFLSYSLFLFTFTFCGTHCFSILSAEQYTFTSFQQNLLFLFTLSLLFSRIHSFSLHFHSFSAEFTLSLYTFTYFQQNSLFLFTLSLLFCRIYSFF